MEEKKRLPFAPAFVTLGVMVDFASAEQNVVVVANKPGRIEDLEAQGAKIISPAKPMNAGTRILAFIEDPDGYVVELNEKLNLTQ